MTSTIAEMQKALEDATRSIPGLLAPIHQAITRYENARFASQDDSDQQVIEAEALDELRAAETAALAAIKAADDLARASIRDVASLTVALTSEEAARAASLSVLAGDTSAMMFSEVEEGLRSSLVRGDRAGVAVWRKTAMQRIEGLRTPGTLPTSDRERQSLAAVRGLITEADTLLRDPSGDPVRETAHRLLTTTGPVERRIRGAQAARGEGDFKIRSRYPTSSIADRLPVFAAHGYHEVDAESSAMVG